MKKMNIDFKFKNCKKNYFIENINKNKISLQNLIIQTTFFSIIYQNFELSFSTIEL